MANTTNKILKNLTKDEFCFLSKRFKSMRSFAIFLKVPFSTFKRYATKYGCYIPNQSGEGMKKSKIDIEKVLKNKIPIKTWSLKQKLWDKNLKEKKCEDCGLEESWNGKIISLELHHIDGNPKNNNIKNLQILCPNCHSQTDNYRNRKRVATLETK